MKPYKVEISVKTIFYTLLIIFGLFVISRTLDILIQLLLSFVLMTALHPLVTRLQRFKLGRGFSVLIVYLLLIFFLVASLGLLLPPLVDQTIHLVNNFNLPKLPFLDELTNLQFTYDEITALVNQYGSSVGTVVSYITSTFSLIFSIFTVLVLTLYLLLEREHLYRYASFLFRTKDRDERSRKLFNAVEENLGAWVRGEFILMVVIGVLTYVGLVILGVPYAVPLAIMAGLLEALPNLGPTIAAIPAVFIAAVTISPLMGLITAVLYMLIQSVENNVVVPQVMKKAVGISPITSIILILAGVRFGGVMGALLVVPVYIIVRVVLREFSHEIRTVLLGKEG